MSIKFSLLINQKMRTCLADKGQSKKQTNLFENFARNKLKLRRVQLSRRLTVFTLMRLRDRSRRLTVFTLMRLRQQKTDDSRLILPINPDKAPKSRRLTVFTLMRLRQPADDSRLILPINPDKAHKVSIIVYNALYMINSR